ncbi:hypothetical protein KBA63_02455 [Candidatus Woesebacteria bacterium]|nr:hypothetical protein [Candidatus Woesebacteria bacterium]
MNCIECTVKLSNNRAKRCAPCYYKSKKGKKNLPQQGFQKGHGLIGNNPTSKGKKWKLSDDTKFKQSKARIGKNNGMYGNKHWNWQGGISNNPYPLEFNPSLKIKIRERDNFTCCLCNRTEREELEELNRVLCVNHIDFNKNNCSINNLNTLCLRCNVKINRDRDYWTNYFKTN